MRGDNQLLFLGNLDLSTSMERNYTTAIQWPSNRILASFWSMDSNQAYVAGQKKRRLIMADQEQKNLFG